MVNDRGQTFTEFLWELGVWCATELAEMNDETPEC